MNEVCWNTIGAVAAAAFLGCLFLAILAPRLKPHLATLCLLARRNPARLAVFVALAAALAVYGGTKPPAGNYRVRFAGGAADAKGGMDDLVCEIGKVYALPANAFTRDGKSFLGWSAAATGRVYDDGILIFNLTNAPGAVVELDALWK